MGLKLVSKYYSIVGILASINWLKNKKHSFILEKDIH